MRCARPPASSSSRSSHAAVRAAYLDAEGGAVEAELRAGWDVEAPAPCMRRSARFAAALEALDTRLGVRPAR